jgi:hypothetical protein
MQFTNDHRLFSKPYAIELLGNGRLVLCINPTYPLPEEEFFAHLYLYVRDREEEVIRVAAPQPWDQRLGRTF